MTTIHEKIKKVFNGGDSSPLVHLNTKQADTFIDYMKDETVLLKKFRTKKMTTPIETVAKIGIGEKVLYPADRTGQPSRETKADPSSIELNVKKFRAMVSFGDDELEDNIEGMSFKEHMMRMVGKAAGNQIEHAALYARFIGASPSIANVVDIENQWSGIFEQAGIVLDASSAKFSDRFIDKIKLTTLRKQFKTKYRQDMEIFMSDGIRQDYVDKYSALS
ncbi:MAG: hypothetical protein LBG52_01645 [Candidatus Peribacteria bacterium]|jgi:hypothetical protein|nr:hypothetical protein [Candidatus Peribacteria bacterium]